MNIQQFQKLINNYLKGHSGKVEDSAINKWFKHNPAFIEKNEEEMKEIGNGIHLNIQNSIQFNSYIKEAKIRKFKNLIRIAAVLILTIGTIISLNLYKNSIPQELISFQTPQGQHGKIILPDSSIIWLNAGTKIRYPKQFNKKIREIYLDKGEAFFEVRHSIKQAFIVHTQNLNTQVLGTSFNIYSDSIQNKIKVTVSTGMVSVFTEPKKVITLTPNECAVYDRANNLISKNNADPYAVTAWKNNVLLFKDDDLIALKSKLEKWYGVKILYKNPIDKSCLITGEFENKSLAEVLKAIKEINGFDYEIEDKKITIINKPCK